MPKMISRLFIVALSLSLTLWYKGALGFAQTNVQNYLPIVMCQDCSDGGVLPTSTISSTSSVTASATAASSVTASATAASSVTPSATAASSVTPSATAASSVTASATAASSVTPSATAASSVTASATAASSVTPSATAASSVTPSATAASSVTPTPTNTAQNALLEAWMLNTTGETAAYITESNGNSILVNVQSIDLVTDNGLDFAQISASGIPNYSHTMTQAEIDSLNNRPRAETDFTTGETSATVGQTVEFGEDIGYVSNNSCPIGGGYGYWPPGPLCPSNQNHEVHFPLAPEVSTETCSVGLDSIGFWLNGSSIFNWGDGFSYNNQGVWNNIAAVAEQYDVDICGGHSAMGDYHHHAYSVCLAEQLSDEGTEHSPIYGFAADGYAVYGPWEAADSLAQSCWKTRDYEDATSPTGCGSPGERSCLLVNQYDISEGTTPAASAGPDTDEIVTTLSQNEIMATSGYYFEDYYYDAACSSQGPEYLDEHNGHSDNERGYHYHITVKENDDGSLANAFPYTIGPTFAGVLPDNSFTFCGGGPPPPPPPPHEHP